MKLISNLLGLIVKINQMLKTLKRM